MIKIEKGLIEFLIIIAVVTLLAYSSDPVLYPDSQRYLNGNLNDPPIFTLIIFFMQSIFGSLNSVIIFQTLLIGFSIVFFTRTVELIFNFDVITKFLVSFFLFLPVIQFYKHILTEPVSYAFSLMFVSYNLKLIYNLNLYNLVMSVIFAICMLLTRNQFMFLYPVILIFYLGILTINNSRKTFFWLTLSFLFIFLTHFSVININKIANKESFANNKTGVFYLIFMDAIYISNSKDIEIFENKLIKNTLAEIFKEMENRKALMKYYDNRGHFSISLKEIRDYTRPIFENLSNQGNNISKIQKEVSLKLIKANFDKYVKHLFKKFYDTSWLFVFLPFFILLGGLINFYKYKSNFSLLLIFISIFSLANHSTIYLFGRVQPRYFIYTDFILLVFILITFLNLLKKNLINTDK